MQISVIGLVISVCEIRKRVVSVFINLVFFQLIDHEKIYKLVPLIILWQVNVLFVAIDGQCYAAVTVKIHNLLEFCFFHMLVRCNNLILHKDTNKLLIRLL